MHFSALNLERCQPMQKYCWYLDKRHCINYSLHIFLLVNFNRISQWLSTLEKLKRKMINLLASPSLPTGNKSLEARKSLVPNIWYKSHLSTANFSRLEGGVSAKFFCVLCPFCPKISCSTERRVHVLWLSCWQQLVLLLSNIRARHHNFLMKAFLAVLISNSPVRLEPKYNNAACSRGNEFLITLLCTTQMHSGSSRGSKVPF